MLGASLAFLTPHNRSNETPRSTTLLVGGGQEAGREKKRKEKKKREERHPQKNIKKEYSFALLCVERDKQVRKRRAVHSRVNINCFATH